MKVLFAFVLMCVCISCTTKNLTLATSEIKLLEMSKSPCFGYCPVYHLTIFDNGLMQLQSIQNLKEPGTYTRQISKSALKALKSQLKGLNLSSYHEEYREPIADAPATTFIYNSTPVKKIFTNFQFPDPLQKMADSLDHIVIYGQWEKFNDLREKKEFIIQLKEGKNIAGVLQRFDEFKLMLGKRLDPASGQYWMVTAMVLPGQEASLLKMLKSDPEVLEAQANKSLETR